MNAGKSECFINFRYKSMLGEGTITAWGGVEQNVGVGSIGGRWAVVTGHQGACNTMCAASTIPHMGDRKTQIAAMNSEELGQTGLALVSRWVGLRCAEEAFQQSSELKDPRFVTDENTWK